MAKGKWEISSVMENGRRMFRCVRKLDESKPFSAENVEVRGIYTPDRSAVEALIQHLNEKDARGQ